MGFTRMAFFATFIIPRVRASVFDIMIAAKLPPMVIKTEGILIKIMKLNYNHDKEKITCGFSKWRGGDGAVGSDKVTAHLEGTSWKITKEEMWIS